MTDTTDIMTVIVNNRTLTSYVTAETMTDLMDITGSFRIDYSDQGRLAPIEGLMPEWGPIRENDPVTILINGHPVMLGWVDEVDGEIDGNMARCEIMGRDVTGDLVDCSANAMGPYEYRGLGLLEIVTRLCAPFGITVTQDTDLGAPFGVVAVDPAEPVMATIEKLSRQRGVLVTSNGIGGLVLTQAGRSRAVDSIQLPGNCLGTRFQLSSRERYSDVYVKGQFKSLLRPAKATLDSSVEPLAELPPQQASAPTPAQNEAASIIRWGHAYDPSVGRYRPRVWLAATQSGGSAETQAAPNPPLDSSVEPLAAVSAGGAVARQHQARRRIVRRKAQKARTDSSPWTLQDQAMWRMRSGLALSTRREYAMPGLTQSDGTPWRGNTIVWVNDGYGAVCADRLIGGVGFMCGQDGVRTRLSTVDPLSYDLQGDEDGSHMGRKHAAHLSTWSGSAGKRS
ncbi:phage baseplate assembly protein [Komagataeibacter xylinus]|uniref:phage baseplate assembly protein n=1 Tax=Komagataeibacter xylinus TaxID=28448 RepID=UPI00280A7634|nr:hypothetical protein [Komagataeibacter xylinus]